MGKTIKEVMEELHPTPKPPTEEEIINRIVDRTGKSGRELVANGLDARHPEPTPAKESASVKLVRLKQAQGFPLSAKEKIVLGFEHLHSKDPEPEPIPPKTAAEIVEEAEREVLAELDSKEETSG